MAKMRGIKPEFWTDDEIVELSAHARLLYIGLWNLACDNGHVEDRPKQIKMRLLPADAVDVDELLDELTACHRVTRGDGWITVPNLSRHQKIDKRYFVTCKRDDCHKPDDAPARPSRAKRALPDGGTPGAHRANTVGTVGARDEGDGEGKVKGSEGEGDGLPARRATTTPGSATQLIIGEWLGSLPKRPPKDVIGQVSTKVASLLKEGIDHADVTAGLAAWQSKGLHPNTLPSVVAEVMNRPARAAPSARPSTTDQRFADAVALSQELAAKENS